MNIYKRADELKGTLKITSVVGEGTEVILEFVV
jgi:signal transduction histidine kinase